MIFRINENFVIARDLIWEIQSFILYSLHYLETMCGLCVVLEILLLFPLCIMCSVKLLCILHIARHRPASHHHSY